MTAAKRKTTSSRKPRAAKGTTPPRRGRGSKLESLARVYVPDRAAWRAWLEANHATSPGIWLVFDKKSAGRERLAYGDAVEEALCFGWIDSVMNPLDDRRYLQLFTPRKARSNWSRLNKTRVERLTAEGLMMPAGLAAVEQAKRTGTWTALDAVEALTLPPEFERALAANATARRTFETFSPSVRKMYLYWITGARREETRAKRIAESVSLIAKGVRGPHLRTP